MKAAIRSWPGHAAFPTLGCATSTGAGSPGPTGLSPQNPVNRIPVPRRDAAMAFGRLPGAIFGRLDARRVSLSDAIWRDTIDGLPLLAGLGAEERSRLKDLAERFLAEKEFTAAGGLELTDAMRVAIAVQGCLPILNLGLECYRGWIGIVVYADEFVVPRSVEDEFGVVHEYDDIASGEAWEGGPLLVSWQDAQMAGDGYNVIIHEFAHKLDMMNGEADGIPPLPAGISRREWEEGFFAAFDDFCARVDEAETRCQPGEPGGETLAIDPYASENPGEFFAVTSEIFFETPEILKDEYPTLYGLFSRFYRQDPLGRKIRSQP
jgi:Mlc titration factor MtfA (ptsG expression regulator)